MAAGNSAAFDASIDSAKRQFELLKSARDPAGNAKPAMPAISMPEMHTPHSGLPAPVRAPKSDKSEPDVKSANWLVDAMLKPRDGPGAASTENRDATARDERKSRDGTREPRADGDQREPELRAEKELAGVNPLAPYLAQWMSPQDYALLGTPILRTAEGDALPGAADLRSFTPRGPEATALVSGPKAGGMTQPAENPYLQALNIPAVPTIPPVPVAVAPAASAMAPVSISPARVQLPATTAATPKPAAPDLLKTHADEKYFKPLKRF